MQSISMLFAAGLLAGALNAAVGGGSFVSIPAMVFAGLPSVAANASSTFTFGRRAGDALRSRVRIGPGVIIGAHVVLSIYAGYFGGGVGIMMMAVWSLLGHADIKAMSAGRTGQASSRERGGGRKPTPFVNTAEQPGTNERTRVVDCAVQGEHGATACVARASEQQGR